MDDSSIPSPTRRFPISVVASLVTASIMAAALGWAIIRSQAPKPASLPGAEGPALVKDDRPQMALPGIGLGIVQRSRDLTETLQADRGSSKPISNGTSGKTATPGVDHSAKVHWLANTNNQIALAPRKVTGVNSQDSTEDVTLLLNRLLVGPNDPTLITTIPKDTDLLNVDTQPDGIHINLSKEFTDGGGSTSMISRVAQVLYTSTSQDPAASVWISIEGKPLTTLGGEGIPIQQPMTRQSFEQEFGTGY